MTNLASANYGDLPYLYAFAPWMGRWKPLRLHGPSGPVPAEGTTAMAAGLEKMAHWHSKAFSGVPVGDGYDIAVNEFDWESYLDNQAASAPMPSYKSNNEDLPSLEATLTRGTSLFDHLEWQLKLSHFTLEEDGIAMLIIGNLTPDGYLEEPLEDLAEEAGVTLELTESTLIEAGRAALDTVDALHEMGVRLAIDDFGTGYSSLAYLKRFPVDIVKIDRTFVDGLGQYPSDTEIVRAVLALGQSLGLMTVAEGVETPEQLAALQDLGCDYAQGYLLSQPIPGDDMVDVVRRQLVHPTHAAR